MTKPVEAGEIHFSTAPGWMSSNPWISTISSASYLRHMQTSHPERAPSAADLEHALSGMDYPATPHRLAARARDKEEDKVAEILEDLKHKHYRDAAEVARAFGEMRAKEEKPDDQPSVRGSEAALQTEAISATCIAQIFGGTNFPASADDLKAHASHEANDEEMAIVRSLPDRRYGDMSDIAKAFGKVKQDDSD